MNKIKKSKEMLDILLSEKAAFQEDLAEKLNVPSTSLNQYLRTLQLKFQYGEIDTLIKRLYYDGRRSINIPNLYFTIYYLERNENTAYNIIINKHPETTNEFSDLWIPLFGKNVIADYKGYKSIPIKKYKTIKGKGRENCQIFLKQKKDLVA